MRVGADSCHQDRILVCTMNKPMPPTPLRQEDYLAIEAAVMETARGRWFLAEYARRNRNSDTDTLLAAIDKLEKTVVKERAPSSLMHRVKIDLADMASAIEKTKQEIAQIKHEDNDGAERFERASSELDAIVSQTEAATGDILGAAEKIQEYAWTLREKGADEEQCDSLDMEATNIYMACSFQDLTGQRIKKIVDAMRYVESRINSMIDIWGFESRKVDVDANDIKSSDVRPDAHLLNGPALEGEGIEQHHVDSLMEHPQESGESNQDDVDALFDTVTDDTSEVEMGDFSNDLDFDQLETGEFDISDQDEEAEPQPEAYLADSIEDESIDPSAEVQMEAQQDLTDVDFVDLDDLDWAEAQSAAAETETVVGEDSLVTSEDELQEADLSDREVGDGAEADIFAAVEPVEPDMMASEDADVFASPAQASRASVEPEADIFTTKPVISNDKDFSAVEAAMQENLQELEADEAPADLRDRVADFS